MHEGDDGRDGPREEATQSEDDDDEILEQPPLENSELVRPEGDDVEARREDHRQGAARQRPDQRDHQVKVRDRHGDGNCK